MKTYFGSVLINGSQKFFHIYAASMADAVALIEGRRPSAVWIESITEFAR